MFRHVIQANTVCNGKGMVIIVRGHDVKYRCDVNIASGFNRSYTISDQKI